MLLWGSLARRDLLAVFMRAARMRAARREAAEHTSTQRQDDSDDRIPADAEAARKSAS